MQSQFEVSSHPASMTLLIVDGHAYAYRAFYAIRELSSPDGAPTNAIYGFIKMFQKMQSRIKPSHVVVTWDGGLAVERKLLLPEYKAQRPSMPSNLEVQIDEILLYLKAARVASYCDDGVEADDRIASLARLWAKDGGHAVIASSDKDFMQLVSENVGLLNPNDKSETIWAGEQVRAKTGVEPHQVVDWLSLIGDSVDNISGVRGVGPKTATELLGQVGSLDCFYEDPSLVKSEKLRHKLLAAVEVVRRNQALIRLKTDLPGGIDRGRLAVQVPDEVQLQELYLRWGFNSLRQELEVKRQRQLNLLS